MVFGEVDGVVRLGVVLELGVVVHVFYVQRVAGGRSMGRRRVGRELEVRVHMREEQRKEKKGT